MERLPPPLQGYHTLAGALAELRAMAPRGLCEIHYGNTVHGEALRAFCCGTSGGTTRLLYMANIHAMEFLGTEVILALAEAFLKNPPVNCEIWLIPSVNPDGRLLAEGVAQSRCKQFLRHNAHGVDLNRNFDVDFNRDYWLSRWLPRLYRSGETPFSEPETAALRGFLAQHPPHFALSLHSFGNRIFYPWSARREPTVDAARFTAIAESMAHCMPHARYRVAQLGQWAQWFAGHGLEIDHLYACHGTLAFLMELSKGGFSAKAPATWFQPLRWFNPPDVSREVENALPAAVFLSTLKGDPTLQGRNTPSTIREHRPNHG